MRGARFVLIAVVALGIAGIAGVGPPMTSSLNAGNHAHWAWLSRASRISTPARSIRRTAFLYPSG